MENNKYDVYRIEIDENDKETGVDFISLVDEPATELDWLKFEKAKSVNKLSFITNKSDKKKQILYGVFITADKKIKRINEFTDEIYYTYFPKDTIYKIVKKFNRNNFSKNVNFQHGNNIVKGYVVENFITSDFVKTNFDFDVPEGSWVGSIHIEDEQFWEDYIESDALKGFSVEVVSKLVKEDFSKVDILEKIIESDMSREEKIEKIEKLLE